MPLVICSSNTRVPDRRRRSCATLGLINRTASACALVLLAAGSPQAGAASLSRSVDVDNTPAEVWSVIGPFCAVKDWLPPVGTCTEDGKPQPTRTLVTRDGKATFVEMQTARSDSRHFYSYTFVSSPLPVTHYTSTIEVEPRGDGGSTITWRSTYVPDYGKDKDVNEALAGIYGAGLDAIKTRLARRTHATTDTRMTAR